jgi:diguanylate cyclase (GGDEF)-like protein
MKWLKKSIANKLILAIIITNLIVFIILAAVTIRLVKNNLINDNKKIMLKDAQIIAEEINTFISKNAAVVTNMETNPKLKELVSEVETKREKFEHPNFREIVGILKNTKDINPNLDLVWLGLKAADDLVIDDYNWAHASTYQMEKMDWFKKMKVNKKLTYTNPYIDQVTGNLIISIVKPIYKKQQLVGNYGIDLNINQVNKLMANYSIGESGYAVLIAEDGTAIYHPELKRILKDNIKEDSGLPKKISKKILAGKSGVAEFEFEGTAKYFAFTPIPANSWSVGVIIDQKEILMQVIKFVALISIIFTIFLFALILISYILINRLTKRIPNLVEKISDFGDGNLFARIEPKSNDEIGQISKTFNNMAEEIAASYQQLEAYNEEITALNEELSYQAFHDPLTKIPNRRKFINILEKELKSDTKGALALLDINDFKEINDNYGHIYGDQLLTKIAQRLVDFSSKNISVARYGGDEFLILIKNLNIREIEKEISKLKAVFNQSFAVKGDQIFIKFALGIALYPEDAKTTDQLITKADIAMYEAKKKKKNDYLYYNQKMIDQLKRRKKIKNKLQAALKNNEFSLKYQPQINLKTGKADFLEALLRLKDNSFSPGEFIPVAEESGLIIEIGRWVTKEAIKQLAVIKNKYQAKVIISINFSVKQIRDQGYLNFLQKNLKKYKIPAHYLEIEITESILIEENKAITFIKELKKIGVKIALDDFGTGYSSFSYLGYLKADKVKLDKFLADHFMEPDNIETLINLINLLHSLDLPIVAEGVETEKQYLQLKENNCNYIQGYYFSKPLAKSKIKDVLKNNYLKSE